MIDQIHQRQTFGDALKTLLMIVAIHRTDYQTEVIEVE
jgi:hypothetical protein